MHLRDTSGRGQSKGIYFPNLDGFRFLSFLLVFLFHCYKVAFFRIENSDVNAFFRVLCENGEMGVNFFFVLSGFLITYLLLQEKSRFGSVNIKRFYIRRILRIWPLYYLCLIVGFVLFPIAKSYFVGMPDESASPLFYLFFLSNLDYIKNWPSMPDSLALIVLWSVSVEEQFYLVWPWLVRYLRIEVLPFAFLTIVLGTLIFRSGHLGDSSHSFAVRNFHTFSVVGDMAIGGLFAYLSLYSERFISYVTEAGKLGQVLFLLLSITCIIFRKELFYGNIFTLYERVIISFVFGMVIVMQNFNRRPVFRMESMKLFTRLGTYTYGLYCIHFIVISVVNNLMLKIGLDYKHVLFSLGLFSISIVLSISVAYLLFLKIETPFLKLKEKYAV